MKTTFWFIAGESMTAKEIIELQKFFKLDRLDIGRKTFIIGVMAVNEPTMEQIGIVTSVLEELKRENKVKNYGFVIDTFVDKRKVLNDIMSSIPVESV